MKLQIIAVWDSTSKKYEWRADLAETSEELLEHARLLHEDGDYCAKNDTIKTKQNAEMVLGILESMTEDAEIYINNTFNKKPL